ncbi:cupin domain-containing protein [Sporosarcina trichiuri]|uniref:cupin domain-containing protein n=1 Tax=Sporosarcina trichiuri TaxID=3056445 RepID=UPI0025B4836E|nr:cupin domain-containing protein [Sporosarcina sp. 0.2-SM1T-5]WJY28375.1 cupin domain-containing protein [Sporosarcina sp. 0.2-SM1T-5]
MERNAEYWKTQLGLESHPEGGSYASTFRSGQDSETEQGMRPLYTSIYFLLEAGEVSHFHQLESDELWYYHDGAPLTVHMISEEGVYTAAKLGLAIEEGERPQILVPAGTIFGSSMTGPGQCSLVGCMVAPGFDFEDFKLFGTDELLNRFPQHEAIIRKMT